MVRIGLPHRVQTWRAVLVLRESDHWEVNNLLLDRLMKKVAETK